MVNIAVSYAEIEQAAARIAAGREDMSGQLASMQAMIQQLITSGFVTEQASGKFHAAYERYTQGARTVVEQLTEVQQFLTQTANAMREMDAQLAARIQ